MHVGHSRARAIPFWCSFVLAPFVFALSSACADRNEKAAENAALAQQALDANDLPAARLAVATAIAERDDILAYHMLRGRIELALGSSSGAFDAYNDALALDPTNGEALLAVAELGLTTGNLRESLDATERVLTLAPNQLDALLIRGIHSIVKRDYQEAIEYGDRILTLSPGHEGGTILKARALFMSRQPEEALATLGQITGDAASSEPAALTRLEIYRAIRRATEMAKEFERLRSLRPNDLELRIDEANMRYKMGDRQQAHELVTSVLANSDATAQQAANALALWQEYGAGDLSKPALARIVEDGSAPARQSFARFLIRQSRSEEAAAVIESLPPALRRGVYARYLHLAGNSAQARRRAAAIIERDATDCDALIAASESALALGMADDALRYAQTASSECLDLPGAWIAAATAYQELGRESGVRRVFGQALDANKQSTELTETYADWLIAEGRTREAVAMARRLTRYAPAMMSGWRLYLALCREHDQRCVNDAERGLQNAQGLLGIDLPPGTPPPNGLFGRLVER